MEFSRELRDDVLAGDITLSVRLWKRPLVKHGGRYPVGPGEIEVDAVELSRSRRSPAKRSDRPASPTVRHFASTPRTPGPIDEDTLVYLIEFHVISPGDRARQ